MGEMKDKYKVKITHELIDATKLISDQLTTTCVWCGEEKIPIEMRSNGRGYGYYGICPKCKKETVIQEVDFTREF